MSIPSPDSVTPFEDDSPWARSWTARLLPPLVAAALFLVGWSLLVRSLQAGNYLLPTPSAVAKVLWQDRGQLLSACLQTGSAALAGLTISAVLGTAIGILFAQSSVLRFALYPYAIFLQTVPIVAIAPLLVMWLGYGLRGVIAVALVLSLFPIIANVTAGMTSVPKPLRELFALYGANRWQRLWKLQLPHAVPQLITGIKTSSGLAVIGAIVGEFFVGYGSKSFGLGYLIRSSAETYSTDTLFAAVVLSTGLGVALFAAVSLLSDAILRRWSTA